MHPWWRGAVVYQIYPRSFRDTNGDGVGDLAGIESKLDYLQGLGVDALWLSPVHPSPNIDFGYDVADFNGVAVEFGGMPAFDRLIEKAHKRGLKIILDEVLSHTSDQHPWFLESLKSRDNPKADWYVWADPREDGTAPNNWLSVFGGPAWSYHPVRRQYYFHKFFKQQPKLNLRNPDALQAALDVLKFWLDRGVDGFRLDVANSFLHDDQLRDNPPVPMAERTAHHWAHAPNLQRRIRDSNLSENRTVLDRIRALVDSYGDRFVFGEFSEEPRLLGEFAGANHGLHTGYTFTFLEDRQFKPKIFVDYYGFLNSIDGLWPCVTFSNHDVPRPVTRYGRTMEADSALAKLELSLALCLKGTVLLYQGEELGLPDGPIERDQISDPVGQLYFPYSKGRDPCRTPMPWEADAANLGFTTGRPWLPIAPAHRALSVDAQEREAQSVLHFARGAIAGRKKYPALVLGDLQHLRSTNQVLSFERTLDAQRIVCVFNLTREPVDVEITWPGNAQRLSALECGGARIEGATLRLEPLSAYVALI
ncbi:MAG: alpha-glucosidase [Alphaproteobacteria bacterium]|nr:alpha-glucosidase [Alphaproteobacteria bacterium]